MKTMENEWHVTKEQWSLYLVVGLVTGYFGLWTVCQDLPQGRSFCGLYVTALRLTSMSVTEFSFSFSKFPNVFESNISSVYFYSSIV